jgi:tRNA A-37 threonylcarbamoyl transferase component Bud32
MPICSSCGTSYESTVRICVVDGTPLVAGRPDDPHIGQMLDGKYRIDAFISEGGMGSVYRATHVLLGKTIAIKLIKKELVTSDDVVRRFQREARAASNIDHPNIVTVHDLGQTTDGMLYIAMEFVEGRSLREEIRHKGPMAPPRIVGILRQVASALASAHRRQIIHRDLKSQNIMLGKDGDGREFPTLVDFGIAKTFDEPATQLTATGFAMGTPQYMSPEQAAGQAVDHRADLYSLGVVLYEMLAGVVPFSDTSLASILVKQMNEIPERPSVKRPDVNVPPALEAIALRCLEKDPARRFQSADEVIAALDAADAPAAIANEPTIVIPRAAADGRRRMPRAMVIALLTTLVISVAVAAALVIPRRSAEVSAPKPGPVQPVDPPLRAEAAVAPPHVEAPVRPPVRTAPVPEQRIEKPAAEPPPLVTPARAEHPPVYFRCNGPAEVCAPIRSEILDMFQADKLPIVNDPSRADIELTAIVSVLDESVTQSFSTTFTTRTYSIELEGESHGEAISMPAAQTFSFDARFGRQRAQERARLAATQALNAVRAFWSRNNP